MVSRSAAGVRRSLLRLHVASHVPALSMPGTIACSMRLVKRGLGNGLTAARRTGMFAPILHRPNATTQA